MSVAERDLRGLPRYLGKGARGRRWLEEFAARQERQRRWVSFAEIADWCARESGRIAPDPLLRRMAFAALATSLAGGEFDCGGCSAVLLLCPGLAPGPVDRRWMAAVGGLADGDDLARDYLALCWLPLENARAWLARKRIAAPSGWDAAVVLPESRPACDLERCAAWLSARRTRGLKREALWQEARAALPGLSTRDFDGAYRVIFRRKRGRPRKSTI